MKDIFDLLMCPYKRVGFQNLINGEVLIRAGRVENFPKINKRASPIIRHLRVLQVVLEVQKVLKVAKIG